MLSSCITDSWCLNKYSASIAKGKGQWDSLTLSKGLKQLTKWHSITPQRRWILKLSAPYDWSLSHSLRSWKATEHWNTCTSLSLINITINVSQDLPEMSRKIWKRQSKHRQGLSHSQVLVSLQEGHTAVLWCKTTL